MNTQSSRCWWSKLSNAAVRSSVTSTVRWAGFFLRKPAAKSAVIDDSAMHVESFGRRPCWAGWKGMCVSILGSRSSSSVLAAGHIRLIGCQSFHCCWPCRVIGSGMIIALCNISGICPVEIGGVEIEDISELVDVTLSELMDVEGAYPVGSNGSGICGQSDRLFCVGRREGRRSC